MKIRIFEREIIISPKILKPRYFDIAFSVYETIYANLNECV